DRQTVSDTIRRKALSQSRGRRTQEKTMFADVKELQSLVGKGDTFEQLVYELLVEEGRRHSIPTGDIFWDARTYQPDGGVDVHIRRGHSDPFRFIPQKPSIWSIKSGENGVNPAKLREELNPQKHPKLLEHLRQGNEYVWCALHSIDD